MERKNKHGRLVEVEIIGYTKHKSRTHIYAKINKPQARTTKEILEGVEKQTPDPNDLTFFKELADYAKKNNGIYYISSIKKL